MRWLFLVGAVCMGVCAIGVVVVKNKKNPLRVYTEKRNFEKTPEPSGSTSMRQSHKPIFVIQKHEASHLHYDFRLEINGVLVSWAVPKGPSLNPEDKRLAVRTEDHPYAYKDFEGVIPEGNYGAGTVMIWDYGTYENLKIIDGKKIPIDECLKEGHIEIFLKGHKIEGGYALLRTHYQDSDKNWLLIKMNDEYASKRKNPVATQTKSAKSGRTMHQIEQAGVVYEQ